MPRKLVMKTAKIKKKENEFGYTKHAVKLNNFYFRASDICDILDFIVANNDGNKPTEMIKVIKMLRDASAEFQGGSKISLAQTKDTFDLYFATMSSISRWCTQEHNRRTYRFASDMLTLTVRTPDET